MGWGGGEWSGVEWTPENFDGGVALWSIENLQPPS